jgi:hypothetical protein
MEVLLEGKFERQAMVFHTRQHRLLFFEAMKRIVPGLRIYRAG